jgi:Mce-associated membrane protein
VLKGQRPATRRGGSESVTMPISTADWLLSEVQEPLGHVTIADDPEAAEEEPEIAGDETAGSRQPASSIELIELAGASDEETASSETASSEPAGSEPESRPRGRRGLRLARWLAKPVVVVVLGVALIAACVLLTLSRMSLSSQSAVNGARGSALAAAKADSIELASYDYHHLDADFGKVLADSTPAFKQNFSQSSSALKTILTRYNATATADVIAAGLVSASTSRAVALVFLNQTVTNTSQRSGQPSTTQSRVEITLLHEHGRWLIDQVSLL